MNILLVDDDPNALAVIKLLVQRLGHTVFAHANPEEALADLQNHAEVDLVMSDVHMEPMSGFDVAQTIAECRGTTPPMVLLISGQQFMEEPMNEFPPAVVIGVLPKPVEGDGLGDVLSLLEASRTKCPGIVGSFCLHLNEIQQCGEAGNDESAYPCDSPQYSCCPHYNECCGQSVRLWISSAGLTP